MIICSAVIAPLSAGRGDGVAPDWRDSGATISTANAQEVIAVIARFVDRAVQGGIGADDALALAVA